MIQGKCNSWRHWARYTLPAMLIAYAVIAWQGGGLITASGPVQTLNGDKTVQGDLYIKGYALDLAGYTLTVYGNLIQPDGNLKINGGRLVVQGDYRLQTEAKGTDGIPVYGPSTGCLIMNDPADYILINGSFIAQSDYNHEAYLTDGTLEVKGDFIQKSGASGCNFNPSGTHKVILSGDGVQRVSFENPLGSGFNTLMLTKPLESGYIFTGEKPTCGSIAETPNQAPTSPGELAVSLQGLSAVLTWASATDNIGVAGYIVYRDGSEIGRTGDVNYTDQSIVQGRNYVYLVKAFDLAGNISEPSTTVFLTTLDTEPPAIPVDLVVAGKTGETVSLAWSPAGDNIAVLGYEIIRNDIKIASTSGTTFTDTALAQGTRYIYQITAYDAAGNISQRSLSVSVVTDDLQPPTAPVGLNLVAITESSASISWTAASDNVKVAGYDVYRDGVKLGSTSETAYVDATLQIGKSYVYCVKAYDAAGNTSAESNSLTVIPPDNEAPSVPTGLTVVSVTDTTVSLSWVSSLDNIGVSGYGVFRNGQQVGTASAAEYTDQGLTQGTRYEYSVRAYDAVGNSSAASEPVIAMTVDTEPPAQPVNLVVIAKNGVSVTLAWTAPPDNVGVAGYKVCRDNTVLGTVSVTTYTDTGLTQGTTYAYEVIACDAAGNESSASGRLTVTTDDTEAPSAPAMLAGDWNGTTVNLSWQAATDNLGVAGYEVYRDGIKIATTMNTAYADAGPALNQTYVYSVKAYDNAGNASPPCDSLSMSCPDLFPPSAPAALRVTVKTADSVTLGWAEATDNVAVTAYEVYRGGNLLGTSTQTGYTDTGLSADGVYIYTVKALDAAGNRSIPSDVLNVAMDSAAPSAPGNLRITASTGQTVGLAWDASPGTEIAGYEVYCNNLKVATVAGTTYTYTYVDNTASLVFVVKAYDLAGNISPESNAVTVTVDVQPPTPPTGLSVTGKSETTVSLAWNTATDNVGVTGYEIYRDSVKVATCSSTSYTNEGLSPNTQYVYTVKAYDARGNLSEESDAVTVITDLPPPIVPVPLAAFRSANSMAISTNGTVCTWGNNGSGQLGCGQWYSQLPYRTFPMPVPGLTGFVAVDGGSYFATALKNDGTVWSWGTNLSGQLGNGNNYTSTVPIKNRFITGVVAIAAGDSFTVALRKDGTVWSWGSNNYGQLGDGTQNQRLTPVQVMGLEGISAIAAGHSFTLALKRDGTVWSWGYNYSGQLGDGSTTNRSVPAQVVSLTKVVAISAGDSHALAVREDGTVWAWGYNYYGQLGDGTKADRYTPIRINGLENVVAISAGTYHSLALLGDKTIRAWGYGSGGQLGNGGWSACSSPVPVLGLTDVIAIAASSHSLARQDDGTIWAWGANSYGQLGDGSTTNRCIPVMVGDIEAPTAPGDLRAVTTTAGVRLTWTAASDNSGIVAGYEVYRKKEGDNEYTKFHVNGTEYLDYNLEPGRTYEYYVIALDFEGNRSVESNKVVNDPVPPTAPTNLVTAVEGTRVSLSWEASTDNIGISGYEVYRGDRKVGTVSGLVYVDYTFTPNTTFSYTVRAYDAGGNTSAPSNTVVATTLPFGGVTRTVALAAGSNYSIINKNGILWAYGANYYGQLGDGTNTTKLIPIEISGMEGVAAVEAGFLHTVALLQDGTVWTCGYNSSGQLGDGTKTNRNVPTRVPDFGGATSIAAGYSHTVAVCDGQAWAWGYNGRGQLGDGTTTTRLSPVQVSGLSNVSMVAAGDDYNLALLADGTVWAWGDNWGGMLGDGTTTERHVPVRVQGLTNVIAVAAGTYHSVALRGDGTVWAWGYNDRGQLGDGTTNTRKLPVPVAGLFGVVAIATGRNHTLALKSDGTVWSWGDNGFGKLGVGKDYGDELPCSTKPVFVYSLANVTAIAAGREHCLAMSDNGSVYGWGLNDGALGDGTTVYRNMPVPAGDKQQPTAPADLVGMASGDGITLTWKQSQDEVGVAGYDIWRDDNNDDIYVKIGTTNALTYVDSGLAGGTTYHYFVQAYDAAGNLSVESNTVVRDLEPPSAPGDLTLREKTPGSITIAWSPAVDNEGVVKYEIYRGGNKIGTATEPVYMDWNLPPGTSFSYTVTAVDAGLNRSSESPSLSVTTDPALQLSPTSIAACGQHSLSVKDGNVWFWGWVPSGPGYSSPMPVQGITGVVAVTGGDYHNVVIRQDGTVWHWFWGGVPARKEPLNGIVSVSALESRCVALQSNGLVLSWVYSPYETTPALVQGFSGGVAVAAGRKHSLILKADGTVWAFGENSFGQLGNGTNTASSSPVRVSGLSGVIAIAAGAYHSLALKSDGTVWAWGYNSYGQLGDSSYTGRNMPVRAGTLNGVIKLAAGDNHSLAIRSDGTVWAWGANSDGQLGINSLDAKASPVKVWYLTDVISIAGGADYSLALKSDNEIWAWGANFAGQLGDGTYSRRAVPVLSGDRQPPSTPTGLTARSTATEVTLTWNASTDNSGVAEYIVYRDGAELATVATTIYIDREPQPGTAHAYTVKARDYMGNLSQPSNQAIRDTEPPAAPAQPTVTEKTLTSISISWPAATDNVGVAGYDIYRDGVKTGVTTGTTYVDTGLKPGTTYVYSLKALDAGGNVSLASDEVSASTDPDTEAPTIPAIFIASESDSTITLSWNPAVDNVGVVSYRIYRDGTEISTVTGTSYTDTGLQLNVNYQYTVSALDVSGNESPQSSPVTARDDHGNALSSATSLPVGLERQGILDYKGDIDTFCFTTTIAGKYMISTTGTTDTFGRLYDRTGVEIDCDNDDGSATNFFIDGDLPAGQTYYVTVRHFNPNATGAYAVSVTMLDNQPPAPPANLRIVDTTPTSITLAWDPSADTGVIAGYQICRDGIEIGVVSGTTFTDKGLAPQEAHTYAVSAFDVGGNQSAPSDALSAAAEADVEAPSTPGGLKFLAKTGSSVLLAWNKATDNVAVAHYAVYRDGIKIMEVAETGYLDRGLTPNTTYIYTVTAVDTAGNTSPAGDALGIIPMPPNITGVEPASMTKLGGDAHQLLKVLFANEGGQNGARATFEYSAAGGNWIAVDSPVEGPVIDEQTGTASFTTYWNVGSLSDGTYMVRFAVTDGEGHSDQATATYVVDRTPPAVPLGLAATSDLMGMVRLSWQASTDADTASYRIYRSTSPTGPWIKLGQAEGTNNTRYDDRLVVMDQTYYYRITAVDQFAQESEMAPSVPGTARADTMPPAILGMEPAEGAVLGARATIVVRAEDNLGLADITLQYSSDGIAWNTIGTKETTGQASFIWETPFAGGQAAQIRVRAIARDAAGNASNGSPVRIFTIDGQGPAQVLGLTATPYTTSVLLRWNDVSDADFDHFTVEVAAASGGLFEEAGTVRDKLGMNVTGLKCGTSYWFRVTAYDRVGNPGMPSEAITVTTTADITPPRLLSLQPGPGYFHQKVSLKATAADDVGVTAVSFQYSTDKATWVEIATVNVGGAPCEATIGYDWSVTGLPEGSYYTRAIARDAAGNPSNALVAASFIEYRVDHTAPAPPAGFTVTSATGYIALVWSQGPEGDLAAYRIYRATDQAGPYTAVVDSLAALSHRDRDIQPGITYHYKLTALDRAGNESLPTGPLSGSFAADNEAPRILSYGPASGMTLPANPGLGVLAADNYKLAGVNMWYRPAGSTGAWISAGSKEVSIYSDVVWFTWNTAGLADGRYAVRFMAVDAAGLASDPAEAEYILNLDPPAAAVLTATPGPWRIDLSWTAVTDPDLAGYRVMRSDAAGGPYKQIALVTGTSYADNPLTPGHSYYYLVETFDRFGNARRGMEVVATPSSEDISKPHVVLRCPDLGAAGARISFDATQSSDNDCIAAYHWDFGDGATSDDPAPSHVYIDPGTYTVVLSIIDLAGNIATQTFQILVRPPEEIGFLLVQVLDASSGAPIGNASVFIQGGDGTTIRGYTDGQGEGYLAAGPGSYRVSAYAQGYKPVAIDAVVEVGQEGVARLFLEQAPVVVGEITARRMSLDEIIAAGVDVSAPENQYIWNFTVHLDFGQDLNLTANGAGYVFDWHGYDGLYQFPNYNVYFQMAAGSEGGKRSANKPPTLTYMVIPTQARWLKEFFAVTLRVVNTAAPEFVIEDAKAMLDLPAGLSLATTATPQSATVEIGQIAGGEEKVVEWVIRGDTKGEYLLGAAFSGMLQPFDEEITAVFTTQTPIRVWGADALYMVIRPDDWAFQGEPYYIKYILYNRSDIPVYNPTIAIFPGEGYTLPGNMPKREKSISELPPGTAYMFNFAVKPAFTGPLQVYSYSSMGGEEIETTIIPIESPHKRYHMDLVDPEAYEAEPVNLLTGAQVIREQLISVNGARAITFEVDYDSRMMEEGLLGKGWSHNFETRLTEMPDGFIEVDWTAKHWNYYYDEDGDAKFTCPDPGYKLDTLVRNPGGGYTLTRQDQTVYIFDTLGRLTKQINRYGQALVMSYDAGGRLTTVLEPVSGQTLTFEYHANGLLATVRDKLGRTVAFRYDPDKRLTGITNLNGKMMGFAYDNDDRVISATDEAIGRRLFLNTYDESGRVVTQDDQNTENSLTRFIYGLPDAEGVARTTVVNRTNDTRYVTGDKRVQMRQASDPLGGTIGYTYDADGNRTSYTDANARTTNYTYDERGNPITITDAAGNITKMTYDARDNLLSMENAMGERFTMTYDDRNNPIEVVDPLGNKTTYEYDQNSLLVAKTVPGYGTVHYTYHNGLVATVTDPLGNTTAYSYDAAGRLTASTDGAGKTTSYVYDNTGNLLRVTDPLGRTKQFAYDEHRNLINLTDPKGNVTSYTYGTNNKVATITDALDNVTTFRYDGSDRLVEIEDALGRVSRLAYNANDKVISVTDPLGKTTNMEYDTAGNLTVVKDQMGRTVLETTYDELNRPASVKDALGNTYIYLYDKAGRLLEIADPLNRRTQYQYDALSRLVASVDALNGGSSQTFDAAGNLTSLTDPNGNTLGFAYDAAGRLISETFPWNGVKTYSYDTRHLLTQVTNGRGQQIGFQYDDAGRLTSAASLSGILSYIYDANGNIMEVADAGGLIKREYDALDRVVRYTDTRGNEIQYAYDAVGNLTELTYPGGRKVRYEYNANNRLIKVTDWAGRVTSYEYDDCGRLVRTVRPDGSTLDVTRNAGGQPTRMLDRDRNGAVIYQRDLTYDAMGDIDGEGGGDPAPFNLPNASMTYGSGNRLATYNGQEVAYDQDGNMIHGPLQGAMATYTYDERNRLVATGGTTYHYDAENNRIGLSAGGLTSYVINPHAALSQVLIKTDPDGTQTFYVYGLGLIGQEGPNGVYLTYHHDIRGSTVALTDVDGTVTDTFQYGPYGELIKHTGATATPFLYNGAYGVMTDPNGLYYMRARYYNPEIKRFVNQDILVGDIRDSQNLNRYAYTGGNPINYNDPFGLCRNKFLNGVHFTLDVLGWIPGAGGFFDTLNGLIYLSEGKYLDAGLSFAGVFLEVFTAGRMAKKAADLALTYGDEAAGVVRCAPAASLDRLALPAPRQIDAVWGVTDYKHGGLMNTMEHIMYRHSSNSEFMNVSRYTAGTTAHDVAYYVDNALRYGDVTPTGSNGYFINYNVGRTIGTNIAGNATTFIQVIVRDGIIRTAYPI